jgi:hypothetical protein
MLTNDLIKRYPEENLATKEISERFKVKFSGLTFNCLCELSRSKHSDRDLYRILIESEEIYDSDGDNYILHTEFLYVSREGEYFTKIMNMLEWNKDILNNLVYDNKQGRLIDTRVSRTITEIEKIDNIRMNYMGNMIVNEMEECCVCYEKTNSKTDCGHTICLQCAMKVKKEPDENDEKYRNCPMCRGLLTMS